MGFAHCPACLVLAFISALTGITRCYMFFIIFRELGREEPRLRFSFI